MKLTPLDLAIFVLYMLAVLGLGLYAARRGTKTKRDYFLAGDKLPWWMIGGSIVAANISSHHLIGVMGTAYSRGAVALVIEWGAILIGLNALLWIFLPFYLRNGFYTVPEFLYRRFGPSARLTYAGLILMTYIFVEVGAVLYMGALAFYTLLGVPIWISVIVLAVATGIYTVVGGLRSVVWTEMLQLGVLLIGGMALSIATIRAVGGVGAVVKSMETWDLILPASDPAFPWTMYLGASLCVSTFYFAANQFIVQRALAAKDEWHARMGIVFTDYLKFLLPLIIIVPGLMAPKLYPNLARADLVFPTLVENLLPRGLIGLVMAGLIAAVMGHTSGAINSCTTIATIDFYLPWKKWRLAQERQRAGSLMTEAMPGAVGVGAGLAGVGAVAMSDAAAGDRLGGKPPGLEIGRTEPVASEDGATDAQAVAFGRWFAVFIIIVGVLCAEVLTEHSQRPIFLYLLDAYGLFTPGIATMFLLGILWRRTTTAGALTAGLMTIPLSVALKWVFPSLSFMNRTGIVFWACMAACACVSLCTKAPPESSLKGLIWTRDSLRLPADERHKYRGLRRPVFWWAIITAVVLFFYVWKA